MVKNCASLWLSQPLILQATSRPRKGEQRIQRTSQHSRAYDLVFCNESAAQYERPQQRPAGLISSEQSRAKSAIAIKCRRSVVWISARLADRNPRGWMLGICKYRCSGNACLTRIGCAFLVTVSDMQAVPSISIRACAPGTQCTSTASVHSPSQYLPPWTYAPSTKQQALRYATNGKL